MDRPTVFVSSTILDFGDLRSALRFWLESLGYRVLISEYADFPASSDKTVYDSCFSAIEQSDVFVLLIGRRRGSWYEQGKLSVTQAEFRHAKSLMAAGKPMKMLIFVRREVWEVKHDRDAIARHFDEHGAGDSEPDQADAARASAYALPSHISQDASHIFQFLEEIAEEEGPAEGDVDSSPPSKANWIRPFSSFDEITAGMGTVIDIRANIRVQRLRRNLIEELRDDLFGVEGEDDILIGTNRLLRNQGVDPGAWRDWKTPALDLGSPQLIVLAQTLIVCSQPLDDLFLREAVLSGEFVTYDPSTGEYVLGGLCKCLKSLLKAIDALNGWCTGDSFRRFRAEFLALGKQTQDPAFRARLNADIVRHFCICLQLRQKARELATEALTELLRQKRKDDCQGVEGGSAAPGSGSPGLEC